MFESSEFSRYLNQRFAVRGGFESCTLELIEVSGYDSPNRPEGLRPKPFSAVFRDAGEPPLAQGTYGFEHVEAGLFELFVVPIGPDDDGFRYEAIFN